jgi:hypothetical protein
MDVMNRNNRLYARIRSLPEYDTIREIQDPRLQREVAKLRAIRPRLTDEERAFNANPSAYASTSALNAVEAEAVEAAIAVLMALPAHEIDREAAMRWLSTGSFDYYAPNSDEGITPHQQSLRFWGGKGSKSKFNIEDAIINDEGESVEDALKRGR